MGDIGEGIVAVLVAIAVLVFVFLLVIPLLFVLGELLIIAVFCGAGLAARVGRRHPWIVEARCSDGTALWWRITGWRASGRHRTLVKAALAAGADLPLGAEEKPLVHKPQANSLTTQQTRSDRKAKEPKEPKGRTARRRKRR